MSFIPLKLRFNGIYGLIRHKYTVFQYQSINVQTRADEKRMCNPVVHHKKKQPYMTWCCRESY